MRYFCTQLFVLALALLAYTEQPLSQSITVDGEAVIVFQKPQQLSLHEITQMVSIDKIEGNSITAYVNQEQLNALVSEGVSYSLVERQRPAITMYRGKWREYDFNSYPTFDDYLSIMNNFAAQYPELCKIEELGTSVNNRKIVALKISDNVNDDEPEAKFFYNSTIHGDETAGYMMTLRLIDSLLSNYGSDTRITNLVDSLEIWIAPLTNPDGTYRGGNSTVQSAQRYNANNVDLNRSFPCPSGNSTQQLQKETQNIMDFFDKHAFTLAADIHGGVELVCYPWGCWSKTHPDQQWFVDVSREYADLAQQASPWGYFTDENNGIINGYDWYPVYGELMNYTLYNSNCRLLTLELNKTKLLPTSNIQSHWEYNREPMLNFMEETYKGIHGIMTKYPDNAPIKAKVTISQHDVASQNSEVYSQESNGGFHRIIDPGTYTVEFTADGMYDTTIQVTVTENTPFYQEIQMVPYGMSVATEKQLIGNNFAQTSQLLSASGQQLKIYSLAGKELYSIHGKQGKINWSYTNHLSPAMYLAKIISSNKTECYKFTVK